MSFPTSIVFQDFSAPNDTADELYPEVNQSKAAVEEMYPNDQNTTTSGMALPETRGRRKRQPAGLMRARTPSPVDVPVDIMRPAEPGTEQKTRTRVARRRSNPVEVYRGSHPNESSAPQGHNRVDRRGSFSKSKSTMNLSTPGINMADDPKITHRKHDSHSPAPRQHGRKPSDDRPGERDPQKKPIVARRRINDSHSPVPRHHVRVPSDDSNGERDSQAKPIVAKRRNNGSHSPAPRHHARVPSDNLPGERDPQTMPIAVRRRSNDSRSPPPRHHKRIPSANRPGEREVQPMISVTRRRSNDSASSDDQSGDREPQVKLIRVARRRSNDAGSTPSNDTASSDDRSGEREPQAKPIRVVRRRSNDPDSTPSHGEKHSRGNQTSDNGARVDRRAGYLKSKSIENLSTTEFNVAGDSEVQHRRYGEQGQARIARRRSNDSGPTGGFGQGATRSQGHQSSAQQGSDRTDRRSAYRKSKSTMNLSTTRTGFDVNPELVHHNNQVSSPPRQASVPRENERGIEHHTQARIARRRSNDSGSNLGYIHEATPSQSTQIPSLQQGQQRAARTDRRSGYMKSQSSMNLSTTGFNIADDPEAQVKTHNAEQRHQGRMPRRSSMSDYERLSQSQSKTMFLRDDEIMNERLLKAKTCFENFDEKANNAEAPKTEKKKGGLAEMFRRGRKKSLNADEGDDLVQHAMNCFDRHHITKPVDNGIPTPSANINSIVIEAERPRLSVHPPSQRDALRRKPSMYCSQRRLQLAGNSDEG